MGVSAVHFGLVMVVNVPFMITCIVVLFLITYIPEFVLTLPRLVGCTV